MDLRISGGCFKGRKIDAVMDERTRYTPEIVRNGIFSALKSRLDFENSNFLDLCAGSGCVSFEALSRGFKSVSAVDISSLAIRTLKENIKKLDPNMNIKLFNSNALRFFEKNPEQFDVIFIDPPFNNLIASKIFNEMDKKSSALKKNGFLLLETGKEIEVPGFSDFNLEKEYRFGSIRITILIRTIKEV